ncbi:response regulator [Dyella monticola]|uniref:histidine kinase n=1 Tax=Dyella monticola TaxID=1927958 RepID=A0A370WSR2_9GAMM|nr:NahK/ErcS family hybrid sensor histidine kinase/response regulator [Dyella monticola]RDS79208.1 response regulator [Dyella monticola]
MLIPLVTMRRLAKLLVCIVLSACIASSSWLAYRLVLRRALLDQSRANIQQLQLHSLALQRLIDRYRVLPRMLALDPQLRAALGSRPDDVTRRALNLKLETAGTASHTSTLTLLDRSGLAIAANNWRGPGSNVGHRYDFRPYFQQARATGAGTFYAVGVSTHEAGYFIAEAVKDARGDTLGVISAKVPLAELTREWLRSRNTILLSDKTGVVFLSSDSRWAYRVLNPLRAADLARLAATRQYEGQRLEPVRYRTWETLEDGSSLVRTDSPAMTDTPLWTSLQVPVEDWTLHLLSSTQRSLAAARVAAALAALMWVPLVLLGLFLRQRHRLIQNRLHSRAELERLVTHYASELRSAQDGLLLAAQDASNQNASLEHLPQGVSVVDGDLRIVAWNSRYVDLFKFPAGLIQVGCPIEDVLRYNASRGLLGSDAVDTAIHRRLDYMRNGSAYTFERERPDGSVLEIRGNPLPDGGFVTSYTDITAYKAAARDLRNLATTLEQRVEERTRDLEAAKAEAEHANRNKTHFTAAAVHDLLQPLNAARLYAGALREMLSQSEARELVDRVENALDTQDQLLASLLDVARLEAGALRPRVANVQLEPLLTGLARQFSILAQARGLHLHYVPTRAVVQSDSLLLRRLLQNFLSNAIHYTPHGRVLLGCRRCADTLRIEVWDTGVGIPPTKQQTIFEEFRRLNTGLEQSGRSVGLGLSIVDRIARLLGHSVGLRSWPGQGSVFSVTVPWLSDAPDADVPSPCITTNEEDPVLHGRRVWCIDDSDQALQAIDALLRRWGCQPTLINDPHQCLYMARRNPAPELLLLDYHLGAETGMDLLGRLTQYWTQRPATIVLTAQKDASIRAHVRAEGLHLLAKPVAPASLRALMSQLLLAAMLEREGSRDESNQ